MKEVKLFTTIYFKVREGQKRKEAMDSFHEMLLEKTKDDFEFQIYGGNLDDGELSMDVHIYVPAGEGEDEVELDKAENLLIQKDIEFQVFEREIQWT